MKTVEICVDCDNKTTLFDNVLMAYQAGAKRVELCSNMSQDGLTPDVESITIARKAFGSRPGVMVMIRPRAGDFFYSAEEVALMQLQIKQAAAAGANGVVLGALTKNGSALDLKALTKLIVTSQQLNLEVGIHRAFDVVKDRKLTLAQLIDFGVNRVLTSGAPWGSQLTASSSIATLQEIILWANEKIEVVIAGGVNATSAKDIVSQLSLKLSTVSLHSYSSVLVNNNINREKVAALVNNQ